MIREPLLGTEDIHLRSVFDRHGLFPIGTVGLPQSFGPQSEFTGHEIVHRTPLSGSVIVVFGGQMNVLYPIPGIIEFVDTLQIGVFDFRDGRGPVVPV